MTTDATGEILTALITTFGAVLSALVTVFASLFGGLFQAGALALFV